jgi:hypothetical protein
MLYIIAPLDAKGNTAYWIEAEQAHHYAATPLVSSALVLQL